MPADLAISAPPLHPSPLLASTRSLQAAFKDPSSCVLVHCALGVNRSATWQKRSGGPKRSFAEMLTGDRRALCWRG